MALVLVAVLFFLCRVVFLNKTFEIRRRILRDHMSLAVSPVPNAPLRRAIKLAIGVTLKAHADLPPWLIADIGYRQLASDTTMYVTFEEV